MLVQALVCFGSLVGRGAYYQVEATRHHLHEFAVLVGASSKLRKGTSLDQVMRVMRRVAPDWAEQRRASGLAFGEGIVWRLRDPDAQPGDDDVVGVESSDKRLLIVEAEFASVLKVARRADNTLSPIVRNAWDGRTLETLAKTAPARATDPHISVIGHITRDELVRNVDATELANGFLNRFLHIAVTSSKSLPFGGDIDRSTSPTSSTRCAPPPPSRAAPAASARPRRPRRLAGPVRAATRWPARHARRRVRPRRGARRSARAALRARRPLRGSSSATISAPRWRSGATPNARRGGATASRWVTRSPMSSTTRCADTPAA